MTPSSTLRQHRAPICAIRRGPLRRGTLIAAIAVFTLGACDIGDGKTLPDPTGTLPPTTATTTTTLLPTDLENPVLGESSASSADAFELIAPWLDGSPIDARHTCDGTDISPALSWVAPPDGAQELAIAVVDESITNGPPFVHWVVAGLDPDDISLLEGSTPAGAVQALNFFGDIGWGGPCPPPGDPAHVYRFTVYALNQQVELADGTPATDLLDFIETVAVASADVTGTYQR